MAIKKKVPVAHQEVTKEFVVESVKEIVQLATKKFKPTVQVKFDGNKALKTFLQAVGLLPRIEDRLIGGALGWIAGIITAGMALFIAM